MRCSGGSSLRADDAQTGQLHCDTLQAHDRQIQGLAQGPVLPVLEGSQVGVRNEVRLAQDYAPQGLPSQAERRARRRPLAGQGQQGHHKKAACGRTASQSVPRGGTALPPQEALPEFPVPRLPCGGDSGSPERAVGVLTSLPAQGPALPLQGGCQVGQHAAEHVQGLEQPYGPVVGVDVAGAMGCADGVAPGLIGGHEAATAETLEMVLECAGAKVSSDRISSDMRVLLGGKKQLHMELCEGKRFHFSKELADGTIVVVELREWVESNEDPH